MQRKQQESVVVGVICGGEEALAQAQELRPQSLALCDQFPALLVQEVDFTGGEPLMRPDWYKIAARLVRLGIGTQILSNGLALEPDTIAQIKDVGISSVGISLDGLEATHDYVRDYKGLFDHALAGMARVSSAGLRLVVLTTVNGLNLPELPALLQVLLKVGVNHWQIQPIFPLGRAHGAHELELTQPAYMQLGAFIEQWGPRAEEDGFKIELADSLGYSTELDRRETPWRGCPAGLVACGITSDGKVKGCLSLPDELVEGDLRQSDLWDIWFHPDAFAYNRRFSTVDLGPACYGCDKAELCKGGCSAMSYGSTGRFHNDPYCFYGIRKRESVPACFRHI